MRIIALFKEANQKLKGKRLLSIAAVLIMSFIISIPTSIDPKLAGLSILLSAPMSLGMSTIFLNIIRGKEVRIEQIFDGFKNYVPAFIVTFLVSIAVIFGLILLIIPGIIVGIGLSMSMFILVDNPTMSAIDVLKTSWEMMKGHKADRFVYILLAIGIVFLGLLTLIIGIFYVLPIIYAASAIFYERIKD
jgi:uncharacterized membrane protein